MNRIRKAFTWSAAEQFGSKAVALITQIVLARLLTPEEFGVLAILLVVVNVADVVAQSGFGQAIIQMPDADETTYSTALWLSLLIAIVLYFIVFGFSSGIAAFYGNTYIELFLKVISLKLFLDSANSIQRSILQKHMDFKSLFVASFLAVFVAGMVGIVLALIGFGIWALIAQVVLNSLFACMAMAACLRWMPRLVFDRSQAEALFSFGWKMAITGVLLTLYSGVSELVVGKTCTAEGLGYYSQGRKYPAAVIGALNNALCNVLFPAFAELRGDLSALQTMAKRGLALGTCFLAPAVTLVAVCAESLVALLLSERWLPSVPVLQIACVPYLFLLLQVVNLRAYMALGRSDVYLKVHIVKAGVGFPVVAGIAVITRDIYIVATATAFIDALCILVVDIAPARRVYGYARYEQLRMLAPTYVSCILAALPAWAVSLAGVGYGLTLALQVAVFVVVYLLAAKLLHVAALKDAANLLKSIMRKLVAEG